MIITASLDDFSPSGLWSLCSCSLVQESAPSSPGRMKQCPKPLVQQRSQNMSTTGPALAFKIKICFALEACELCFENFVDFQMIDNCCYLNHESLRNNSLFQKYRRSTDHGSILYHHWTGLHHRHHSIFPQQKQNTG